MLPNYTNATCSPLNEDGVTDDTANINNCISAASANTAVFLPAGNILVNGTVRLKSNVVLRGAKAQGGGVTPYLPTADSGATTIILGASAFISTQNFSFTSNLNPSTSFNVFPSTFTLTGTPQKGDTTVTIGSGSVSVGTWIKVFGNDDPTLINSTGIDGTCQWCGDNTSFYVQQQIVQVTALNGSVATISQPLYYKLYTTSVTIGGNTEPAGAKYNIITFPTVKAGFENLRVSGGSNNIGSTPILTLEGCLECWVKSVETFDTGTPGSGSVHVFVKESYAAEIRDSYFHDQRSGSSGAGYGVDFFFSNGNHKVENNVIRHNRHGIAFEGGGSGCAILYNYIDDEYTDDLTYLGSARNNHGAHPYMNLYEGNVISHIAADDFWGTSSHHVFFRNWIWGDETGTGVPSFPPNNGYDAIDLYQSQSYYSFVGNVLGNSSLTGANHAVWSAATVSATCTTNNCGGDSISSPVVYSYGSSSLGSAVSSSSTILRHGNYDLKTVGVAFWDGGSNHTLATSIYYASQPTFLSGCVWPAIGPDITSGDTSGTHAYRLNTNVAQAKFNGMTCPASSGSPGASLSPTSIAFGIDVISISSGAQSITLTNTGSSALTITGIIFVGTNAADFSQTNNCPGSLGVSLSCTISIIYTPSSFGYGNANLSVNDNASGAPQTAALSGFGANPSHVGVGRFAGRKF